MDVLRIGNGVNRDMDRQEMIIVLNIIKGYIGLCKTEKEAIEMAINQIEADRYEQALKDVEKILQNKICSVKNGMLLMVQNGVWRDAFKILREKEKERKEGENNE